MSHISRTRSAAAGVQAPGKNTEGSLSTSASNAATAAKSRHNNSAVQPPVMPQQQMHTQPSQSPEFQATAKEQQLALAHQRSIDENVLETKPSGNMQPPPSKPSSTADSKAPPSSKQPSRTRSLPPKPKAARTRSAKPAAAKPSRAASSPAEPAEHAEHAEPKIATAGPSNPLASTLASLAQGLAAARNSSAADAAEDAEQIDLDIDFSSGADDSDFQPDNEAAEADDVEVLDLSQEDPLDVVEQADGLVSIRSPPTASAAQQEAAGASSNDDDEEEFQQLAGKRKQPAKAAAKGVSWIASCLQATAFAPRTLSSTASYYFGLVKHAQSSIANDCIG